MIRVTIAEIVKAIYDARNKAEVWRVLALENAICDQWAFDNDGAMFLQGSDLRCQRIKELSERRVAVVASELRIPEVYEFALLGMSQIERYLLGQQIQ